MKTLLQLSLITMIIFCVFSHEVAEIQIGKSTVSGYTHVAKTIDIPFSKCFQIYTELEADEKYINFKPTSLRLDKLKQESIKQDSHLINIQKDLRNPQRNKHSNIVVMDGYIIVFSPPKTVLIVEEKNSTFNVKLKYQLVEKEPFIMFKIYKFMNKGLMVIYKRRTVRLLDEKGYTDITLPEDTQLTHLEQLPDTNQIIASEFTNGLAHYKLDLKNKRFQLVKRYKQTFKYIVDVTLRFYSPENKNVYLLDADQGVFKMSLQNGTSQLIIPQEMCDSFDSISQDHFVLLCQAQGRSNIIEATLNKKTMKYQKSQPVYYSNYLNDLHVTSDYYILYSYRSLHVFWNTQMNRLTEMFHTQNQIVLKGLETFTIMNKQNSNFLYAVESGKLVKYQMQEQKPSLSILSQEPIKKSIELHIVGNCQDLNNPQPQKEIENCKANQKLQISFSKQQMPRKGDFNISASIIVILIIIFLLAIWICLKKYKGLERQARRILENYKTKKDRQRRPI